MTDTDALVYELTEMVRHSTGEYKYGIEAARLVVMEAPTVGEWISVEDRLPVRPPDVCGLLVRRQWYLVALKSGAVLTLAYEFDEDRWQGVGSPVTHWMPLPDPPKEATRDGNC